MSRDENTVNPNDGTNSSIITISPKANTQPKLYNFEAIIAVAFSVNSKRALQVRRWAKEILENVQFMMVILGYKWVNMY